MQPEPDLSHCYYYNADACCVAGHDEMIGHGTWEGLRGKAVGGLGPICRSLSVDVQS